MDAKAQKEILSLLDFERQTLLYPGVTRFSEPGVIRDVYDGENSSLIAYSCCPENELDRIIGQQIQLARGAPYKLEWKVYGHDQPRCLGERLAAAGFKPEDKEQFMVFRASPEALDRFGVCSADIRLITNREGLKDYQKIWEEVDGESQAEQIQNYARVLENHPNNLSVYVAYVDGEPAACGRTYFHEDSKFAGLYGGQTRERFRNRGLFTQVVATRIREALNRGVTNISVDALPTSEPILRKHGFEIATYTQPFCFSG